MEKVNVLKVLIYNYINIGDCIYIYMYIYIYIYIVSHWSIKMLNLNFWTVGLCICFIERGNQVICFMVWKINNFFVVFLTWWLDWQRIWPSVHKYCTESMHISANPPNLSHTLLFLKNNQPTLWSLKRPSPSITPPD